MIEQVNWLSQTEAGQILRVEEKTLENYRERGYLKPGKHWRSSSDPDYLPWKPKVFYCIRRCREFIENLEENDKPNDQIAA